MEKDVRRADAEALASVNICPHANLRSHIEHDDIFPEILQVLRKNTVGGGESEFDRGWRASSISFASPEIATEWGIDRAALGIVLSMELVGMAIGSMLLGRMADQIGRRKIILGCLVVMAVGMFMATTVRGIVDLSIWRVVTGLGIGGMLAATNAVAAEFSNSRRRNLSVLMAIGYPVGAVLGGLIARQLLKDNDWRTVFYFGAGATAALIPLVYFFVPESVHFRHGHGLIHRSRRAADVEVEAGGNRCGSG